MVAELKTRMPFVHVLTRKEMENYLLQPAVLQRVVERWVKDRARRRSEEPPTVPHVTSLLRKATSPLREDAQAQYLARRLDYDDRMGRSQDRATVTKEVIEWFASEWSDIDTRISIVPGKRALAEFRRLVQEAYSITLSDYRIIAGFSRGRCPE